MIYLCGKLDTTEETYNKYADVEEFIKTLRAFDGEKVINLTRISDVLPALTSYQFQQIAFQFITIADTIFMVNGWQRSKMAHTELAFAKALGKRIIYQDYYKRYRKEKNDGNNE